MLSEESKSPELARFRPPIDEARPTLKVHSGVTLLLGGARSGKSDLAVETATQWAGPVVFVATAQAHDDDMAERISAHQQDRPDSWGLVEQPTFSATDVDGIDESALIIIDCLTLLVSNLLLSGSSEHQAVTHSAKLASVLAQRRTPTFIISNEVGLGVHPATTLGAQYRDTLGRVNTAVSRRASTVAMVVAGRVLPLVDLELQVTPGPNRADVQTPEGPDGHL